MTASAPTERQLEVAIYAARTTDKAAAEHFGIPRRTVTNMRNRWQGTPEFRIAKARLAAKLADQYADLEQLAIDRAMTALRDPTTPARDVATLGKWISDQRALLLGDPTSRTETTTTVVEALSYDERDTLERFLLDIETASDDELREWASNGGLAQLRHSEQLAAAGPEAVEKARRDAAEAGDG